MHISVVIGTARIANRSIHAANAVAAALSTHPVTVDIVPVAKHVTTAVTTPPWGEGGADTHPTAWKDIVANTDAFVFVLPEYNHSYPGEWKLLMDSLYPEYKDKQAYVVAVGGGQFAGARVMEHVLPVLVNFQFRIGNARLHVANASASFAEDGSVADPKLAERIATFATAIATT
jgi:NAD(P)H-dependent FMN reductase